MANIKINTQYIKDLSFETPGAPEIFLAANSKPDIAINIDIDAKKISVNGYEIVLKIKAEAKNNEKILFICELSYAGIFTLDEKVADEKEIEQILLIYCPNILFPFLRKIVANTVNDGGFPPLLLDPINFAALYQQRQKEN